MRFVVLPGLDGTGRLLNAFSEVLGRFRPVDVVAYPPDVPLGYDALAAIARARLPREPFVLVGESFSGPIALRLAAEAPPGLKGIALGASFARLDMPMKPALSLLARLVPPRFAPFAALDWLLMGSRVDAATKATFREVLASVAPDVLRLRARAALSVDLSGQRIASPALYLRATEDRLMPRSTAEGVARIAPNLAIVDVPAPHFLFQAEPSRCAEAIGAFAGRL